MMQQNSSTNLRRPGRVGGKSKPRVTLTCLLCRILWPILVEHRHVFLASHESKTPPMKSHFKPV
ncbi:MAG: hypothetical protein WAM70_16810 [Pyrinomonadaceae bacterium]